MHVMHLLNLQQIAWDCFNEVQQNKNELHALDINLRYASRATDTFIQLYDRLERHWAKQNSFPSGERVLVPLTPNTLIVGETLRQIMEWDRVELYLSLKAQNPFESILADLIVRTHKAGCDCYEQADWKRNKSEFREINLKYALKGIDSSARLLARLEGYRASQIGRVLHNSTTGGETRQRRVWQVRPPLQEARQSTRKFERQWQAPINETRLPCSAALAVARGLARARPAARLR